MTAGHGVAHSEEGTGRDNGGIHGVQLWVAQPGATRHGPGVARHRDEATDAHDQWTRRDQRSGTVTSPPEPIDAPPPPWRRTGGRPR
jgi:redox-sensitive bicupin YhaK (pirin superfamily)